MPETTEAMLDRLAVWLREHPDSDVTIYATPIQKRIRAFLSMKDVPIAVGSGMGSTVEAAIKNALDSLEGTNV